MSESAARFALAGRLVDPEGRPIAEAQVSATTEPAAQGRSASLERVTSHSGQFRFEFFRPVVLDLQFDAPGYALLTDRIVLKKPGEVELTFVLPQAEAQLEGRVLDVFTRRPLAGAAVRPRLHQGAAAQRALRITPARSDEDGAFRFDRLPAQWIHLEVSQPGYFEETQDVKLEPGKTSVEFTLVPGDTYEFIVEDEWGAPIAEALIVRPDGLRDSSDERGRFSLPLIPELNSISLQVWKPGYRTASLELPMPPDTSRIVLEPGFPFSGVVVTPEGLPIPEASVAIIGSWTGFAPPPTTTDARGEFSVILAEPRARRIQVGCEGFVTRDMVPPDGSSPLQIVLQPAEAALTGQVIGHAQMTRGSLIVTLQRLEGLGRPQGAPVHPDGRFAFDNLAAGRYRLTATQLIVGPPPIIDPAQIPTENADLVVARTVEERFASKVIDLRPGENPHVVLALRKRPSG